MRFGEMKRIWMTEADYRVLKAKAANRSSEMDEAAEAAVRKFARSVIDTFGLADSYKVDGPFDFSYRRRDHGAERFAADVRNASKHAAAKDAVKRLRSAVKEAF
jgi:hypothetical protein